MGNNDPPKLKAGDVYSSWKRKITIWQCGTTLDTTKQAARVIQALEGKALDFATRISIEKIKSANGVELVLAELDKHFKKDETQTAFITAENFENYRRTDESISEYIEEFCRRKDLVDECDVFGSGSYKDGILAYRLLKQASLTPTENQLIRATIPKLTFENMVNTMKKTLGDLVIMEGSDTNSSPTVPIKQEPTYLQNEEDTDYEQYSEEQQFYGNNFRGRGNFRGSYRPYNNQYRSNNYQGKRPQSYNSYNRGTNSVGNKTNSTTPQNNTHNPSSKGKACFNCKSIYHLKKDCPDIGRDSNNETSYFQKASDKYELIDDDFEAVLLVEGTQRRALIDSGCVTSVCGESWLNDYLRTNQYNVAKITETTDKKSFRFGDGRLQESTRVLTLPIHLCGKDLELKTFVIDGDIPLLMSRNALKEYGASIDFKEDVMVIDGTSQSLTVTDSGHYVIDIDHPLKQEDVVMICNDETDPKKAAIKLHRYFGHPSSKRLIDMVKESNLNQEIVTCLKDLECETCIRFKKERPKPKSSMMMSSEFNELVSMDLKKLSTGHLMLHMIDKEQETIVGAMFKIWISIFGRSKLVFSDNGGEFVNESFIAMCEDLGVKVKTTAANSPFSNGLCERHNALIAETYDKIIEDVKCSPEVALAWSTNAKNSYSNSYGFSPYTLVLGKTPHIPGLDDIKLVTELNETTVSKMLADHLNAMYLSRQAYMKAMQSDRLKRALKDRITFQDEKYFLGDQVYFKRKDQKRWQGPASVLGQDGKIVIVRQGGYHLRVHSSRVILSSRAEREILGDSNVDKSHQTLPSPVLDNLKNNIEESSSEDDDEEEEQISQEQTSDKVSQVTSEEHTRETTQRDQLSETQRSQSVWNMVPLKTNGVLDLNNGDKIRLREDSDEEWEEAIVLGPGGKSNGKLKNRFNVIKADESKHHYHLDKMNVEKADAMNIEVQMEKSKLPTEQHDEPISLYIEENTTYAVNIPKERYNEPKIRDAMNKELQQWKDYKTYREVYDRGQKTISTRWVVTEKKDGFKARLVVRGFEEVDDIIQADSPTGDKATLRLVLAISASEKWKLQSIDIKSAYLQSETLDREVFVKPPKELKKPGLIWALDKPAYGLIDSARNWHCSISNFLTSLGCQRCMYDKALFFYYVGNKLNGLIIMHVDDFIFCGSLKFNNDVLKPLKTKYDISKHEQVTFRYIGIEVVQKDSGIILDQSHYLQCIQPIILKATRQKETDSNLTKEEQTQYLSLLGKISWLAQITRPDLKFDVYMFAKHNKSANVQNLIDLNGIVSKVFNQQRSMFFPSLDKTKPWKLAVYADASFANMDNKVNSARGYIVLLCDGEKACLVTWNANKITRVVTSTLEAETLALRDGIRHAELIRTMICMVKYNGECDKGVLPIIGFTDSDQLWKSVHSSKRCKDVALHRDICLIQEKVAEGILSELRRIGTNDQIADCLTKKGANPRKLSLLVETGLCRI